MSGSGLLTSDYGMNSDPVSANASALGAPPPELRPRPAPTMKPVGTGDPNAPVFIAPKTTPEISGKPETNLTIARRQREQGENPSRDPNAQNPYSSAGGKNQIIDGTWLELMGRHHPEMIQGQTKEQILAMKTNGALNDEMAGKYDEENARALSAHGIAPTPNFVNVMYRAGPGDGLKLIQAAQSNPGALVKDIAPALASPGNNGAGDMTVGQFLMTPYGKGPGAPDGSTPQQQFTIARGNQILAQLQQDEQTGREQLAKLDRSYKPLEFGQPPKPPETDPLKTFGSLAGVFATLAAGFSRTPAIAAMNGLSGAMDAAKKNDWETYKAQYDQFKTGSELMLRAHEQHSSDVRLALETMTRNMAAGTAMLNATMALSNDEAMQKHMALGDYVQMGRLQDERDKTAREIKNTMPVTLATADLTATLENLKAAQQGGNPEEIQKATELVTKAENQLAAVKRAGLGGAKPETPQAISLRRFMDENPTASAQDIQRFITGFKEDAPNVAARKEAADAVKARHYEALERIADDKTASVDKRAERIADERERHDKAMEELVNKRLSAAETTKSGSASAERSARFRELKELTPEATDSQLWDAVDRQMLMAKTPHMSEGGLRVAAERFLAGDATALSGFGRNPGMFAQIENMIAKVAEERHMKPQDIVMAKARYGAMSKALKDFATGKQGQTAQSLNVATQHLALLGEAAKALAQNDSRTLNLLQNAFKHEFGWDQPVTFNAIKSIVGSEVEKAVAGSAGALEDRRELREGLSANSTPEQVQSVIEGYKGLMAGQLQGLEKTYERTTGQQDFRDTFLLPEAAVEMNRLAPRPQESVSFGGSELPDAARRLLTPGHETTFSNGQIWTQGDDGLPKRVR